MCSGCPVQRRAKRHRSGHLADLTTPPPRPPTATLEILGDAVDQASTPIVIADALGRITYANQAAAGRLGLPVDRVRGRHFSSLIADPRQRLEPERISHRVASGEHWSGRIEGRGPDGAQLTYELVVSPVKDDAGAVTHSIALLRDVSREREVGEMLSRDLRQQAAVSASLAGLDPGKPISVVAGEVARAFLALDGVDFTRVIGLGDRDHAEVLADSSRGQALPRHLSIPATRTAHLRARAAEGAWVEAWTARREYGRYARDLKAAGIRAAGYAPLRHAGRAVGLLAVATLDPRGVNVLERHLSALAHFGALASGLLGPGLAARQHDADLQAELQRVITQKAFSPVFQPVVRLADRRPIAYEALTRFNDGISPERRFADAEAVGLGVDLETATLRAVMEAADALPRDLTLSVNVSPRLVTDHGALRELLAQTSRPMILEITEHEPIADYDAFREAVSGLDVAVDWAVDDAGAGYASLRHIIELRPQYVKLDHGLVRGVNADPIRQALIAGMLHFAGSIGLSIIAEGIEAEAERLTLHGLGIDLGQGFLFGAPKPAQE